MAFWSYLVSPLNIYLQFLEIFESKNFSYLFSFTLSLEFGITVVNIQKIQPARYERDKLKITLSNSNDHQINNSGVLSNRNILEKISISETRTQKLMYKFCQNDCCIDFLNGLYKHRLQKPFLPLQSLFKLLGSGLYL